MGIFEKFKKEKGIPEETKYAKMTKEEKKEYYKERLTLREPRTENLTTIKINYQKAISMLKMIRDTERERDEAIKTGSEVLKERAIRNYLNCIKKFANYWNKYIEIEM